MDLLKILFTLFVLMALSIASYNMNGHGAGQLEYVN